MPKEIDCLLCDEDGQIVDGGYMTCPECNGSKKVPAPKDYEMIGCPSAGGQVDLDKILEYFSDRCAQSCPNWNLCSRMISQD
jgi:hypothetical protein